MKEIISVRFPQDDFLAGYNLLNGNIYYNQILDKPEFEAMKKIVLDHEMQHLEKPENFFWHIYIDYRDYPRYLLSHNWYLFNKHVRDHYYKPRKWWYLLGMNLYAACVLLLALLLIVPQTLVSLWYNWRKR